MQKPKNTARNMKIKSKTKNVRLRWPCGPVVTFLYQNKSSGLSLCLRMQYTLSMQHTDVGQFPNMPPWSTEEKACSPMLSHT